MKKDNKSYVTLSVISSFKRIGTRNEIKSFFYKIKKVIKTEERVEEEFSILLIDFYKKYINYEQVKLLIKKLNEIELLFKKYKFYNEYKNLFKEFEVFSEIVELREAGKYFTDKFKEIAICLLPEEQYYPSLDNKRRKFYDTLLPEAEPIWLAESEDTFNVSKIGVVKKTFYFSERYHIRTYKNGIEDGIRIVYFWEKNLKAEEYYVNGKFQARVNVYYSDGDKEIYYMRKNKDGLYEKYGKYIYFFKDGMISEGYYSNNEKTGNVTYYHLDGTYRKGHQEKGYLIKETSILYDIYGNIIKEVNDK